MLLSAVGPFCGLRAFRSVVEGVFRCFPFCQVASTAGSEAGTAPVEDPLDDSFGALEGPSQIECSSGPSPASQMTPLEETVMRSLLDLHPSVSMRMLTALRASLDHMVKVADPDGSFHYDWLVGSLYSGSDIGMTVVNYQCAMWKQMLGVRVVPKCVYQVELNPEKRRHLMEHTVALHTFDDVAKVVNEQRQYCFRQKRDVVMPWAHTLMAGFPCTTRARTSRKGHEGKGCVQRAEGETGAGFGEVKKFIISTKPRLVILENVIGLMEQPSESDAEDVSDADFILQELWKGGYWCHWFRFDAHNYGSPAVRERIYMIGILGKPASTDALTLAHDIFRSLKRDPVPMQNFVEQNSVARQRISAQIRMPQVTPKAKQSESATFRDEHLELFRCAHIEWPVVVDDLDLDYYQFSQPWIGNDRVVEEVVFLDKVFPARFDIEFVDANKSIAWLTGWSLGAPEEEYHRRLAVSPWRSSPSTMVPGSILVVRFRESHVRILEGWEHMMIGWHPTNFNPKHVAASHECLVSMAGNAFSGFAAHPVFVAGLCMTGGLCSEKAVQGEKSDELLLASSEDLGSLEVIVVVVVDGSAIVASTTTVSVHIRGYGMHDHRRCFHHHCLCSHTWTWLCQECARTHCACHDTTAYHDVDDLAKDDNDWEFEAM